VIDPFPLYGDLDLAIKTGNGDFAIHCTIMTLSQVNPPIPFVARDLQESCSIKRRMSTIFIKTLDFTRLDLSSRCFQQRDAL